MGLCSYLLIGFWYAKPSARDAAVKAFMTTRVGDVFMLLGHRLSVQRDRQSRIPRHLRAPCADHFGGHSNSAARVFRLPDLIGLLLFIGTVGKSAQFPLHVWLPDAMEGPDACQRHDPRGDHGIRRRLHGHSDLPAPESGSAGP